jgi:hypothetical protein
VTFARDAVRGGAPLARKRLVCGALVGALAFSLGPGEAVAEERTLPQASRTFEYTKPAEKYYLRATLEELGLLSLGLVQYFANQDVNSADWDLDYDWPSLRAKLVGDAYAFDTNLFETNFVAHPAAGMLYYFAARSNRLSVLESVGYAFVSSALWEVAGEYRELVSLNDLVMTPLAGFTLGESTTAIGAFFDRSCDTGANRVLGSVFGPAKSIHDAVDGMKPARSSACDQNGLSTLGGHRLHVYAGSAAVFTGAGHDASGEARFGASAQIVHLNELGRPGHGWLTFSDGNISSLAGGLSMAAGHATDLTVGARVVPAGLHFRDLTYVPGFGAKGSEVVLGLLVGSEYSQHRYDRPSGKLDRFFVLDLPATTVTLLVRRGRQRLEASLDAGASLAGVNAFALGAYRSDHSGSELSSVTDARGYSHAAGFALSPRLRLVLDGAEIGLEGRNDRLYGLRMADRSPTRNVTATAQETRRRGTLWLSIGPSSFPRITFFADGRQRTGTIAEASNTRTEIGLGTSLDAVY